MPLGLQKSRSCLGPFGSRLEEIQELAWSGLPWALGLKKSRSWLGFIIRFSLVFWDCLEAYAKISEPISDLAAANVASIRGKFRKPKLRAKKSLTERSAGSIL